MRIDEKIIHYRVSGNSAEELRAQLRHGVAASPEAGGTTGRTHSSITIAYGFDKSGSGCRMDDLEVDLQITVVLPEWVPGAGAGDELKQRWSKALAALEKHEQTHRANARAAADEARSLLLAIGPQPDCKTVRRLASQQLRRTTLKHEFIDKRYDARTRNGASEGTSL